MPFRSASRSNPAKTLVALSVGVLVLACGACGRRGALEPPGGSAPDRGAAAVSAPASPRSLPGSIGPSGGTASVDPDAVRAGEELPVSATPAGTDSSGPVQTERGAKKGYRIPKGPFVLDPIL